MMGFQSQKEAATKLLHNTVDMTSKNLLPITIPIIWQICVASSLVNWEQNIVRVNYCRIPFELPARQSGSLILVGAAVMNYPIPSQRPQWNALIFI